MRVKQLRLMEEGKVVYLQESGRKIIKYIGRKMYNKI